VQAVSSGLYLWENSASGNEQIFPVIVSLAKSVPVSYFYRICCLPMLTISYILFIQIIVSLHQSFFICLTLVFLSVFYCFNLFFADLKICICHSW